MRKGNPRVPPNLARGEFGSEISPQADAMRGDRQVLKRTRREVMQVFNMSQ